MDNFKPEGASIKHVGFSLLRQLLLDCVPGSELRELLQNADDAGAKTVRLCLDLRAHSTDALLQDPGKALEGPALLCLNDGHAMSKQDIKAVCAIGCSAKRKALGLTGRSGYGFASVYLIADAPSIVTGRNLIILDPQRGAQQQMGKVISLDTTASLSDGLARALKRMHAVFNCRPLESALEGSLFRLPLRAAASMLSEQVYTVDAMRKQLDALASACALNMLFLKNVQLVEVYEVSKSEPAYAMPHLKFSCRLENASSPKLPPLAVPGTNSAEHPEAPPSPGLAFCGVALPDPTGLPIHIDAAFELTGLRREIWHGTGLVGPSAPRANWNSFLLREVAGPAYARLLAAAAAAMGPVPAVWRLFPDLEKMQPPWDALGKRFYEELACMPVVYSAADWSFSKTPGGRWLRPAEAVYYVKHAVLPDSLVAAINGVGVFLASAPPAVTLLILKHCPFVSPPPLLSPSYMRDYIMKSFSAVAATCSERPHFAYALLDYCLSDLDDWLAAPPYPVLGLPLLPLRDGSLVRLCCNKECQPSADGKPVSVTPVYYVSRLSQKALLHKLPELLLNTDVLTHKAADNLRILSFDRLTCLRQIDSIDMADVLLPRLLPAYWRGKREVVYDVKVPGHPAEQWIEDLWDLLKECGDLAPLQDWPILPVRGKHPTRLAALLPLPQSTLLRINCDWPTDLSTALNKMCVRLVSLTAGKGHPQLADHVHPADGRGLLAAVAAAGAEEEAFRAAAKLPAKQRRILRQLLLEAAWSALPEVADRADAWLTDNAAVSCASRTCGAGGCWCQRVLGVQVISRTVFLKMCILPRAAEMPVHARDAVMCEALRSLPQLIAEDPSMAIEYNMRTTAWVPAGSGGELHMPHALFDPRRPLLKQLLGSASAFPAAPYADDLALLNALQRLGLRTKLDHVEVLDAARCIAALAASNAEAAAARGAALLQYLDEEAENLGSGALSEAQQHRLRKRLACPKLKDVAALHERFWRELTIIAWCPALVKPPAEELPWLSGILMRLAAPMVVRPQADMWLVSSTKRLLDGLPSSPKLLSELGWDKDVPARAVISQLAMLGRAYPAGSVSLNTPASRSMVAAIPAIYARLQTFLQWCMDNNQAAAINLMPTQITSVWVGDAFAQIASTAISCPLDLRPWLHVVPAVLKPYHALLLRLGVAETFAPKQLALVLHDMATQARGRPLPVEQLRQAIGILQMLEASPKQGDNVLVPNARGELVTAASLRWRAALDPKAKPFVPTAEEGPAPKNSIKAIHMHAQHSSSADSQRHPNAERVLSSEAEAAQPRGMERAQAAALRDTERRPGVFNTFCGVLGGILWRLVFSVWVG
ncbi:hypothetical protein WJX81_001057 [Elliptochloris bilobata]|uniref:Sacsin/Nov domain-containing protein n=1 Tax=Elliptochloris bilobata TaxID=381761 RepID=A0AAW1QI94_9CHLO